MENELIIARFNKLLDQKLKEDRMVDSPTVPETDFGALFKVAELLRRADYSGASRVREALWGKMLEVLERKAGDGELDEDELYQATGGTTPPPEEGLDPNNPGAGNKT